MSSETTISVKELSTYLQEFKLFQQNIRAKCSNKYCMKIDHMDCYIQRKKLDSERVKKAYHEKYKNEYFLCECGLQISRANKKHILTEKHKNLLLLKQAKHIQNSSGDDDNFRTS